MDPTGPMLYQSLSGGHLRILHRCHQMIGTFDRVMHKEIVIGLERSQEMSKVSNERHLKRSLFTCFSHCVPLRSELNFKDVHEGFKACFSHHVVRIVTRSDKPRSCLFGVRHVLFGPFSGLMFSQLRHQRKGCREFQR